jgi:hypothetical protein
VGQIKAVAGPLQRPVSKVSLLDECPDFVRRRKEAVSSESSFQLIYPGVEGKYHSRSHGSLEAN